MQRFLSLLTTLLLFLSPLAYSNPHDTLSVVNERMNAYNNHDLKRFLLTYADDIQVYDYPDKPIGKPGKAHIKGIFKPLFEEGIISVKIHHQITQGNYVINHETVTHNGKDTKYVSIYEVTDGLIASVRFVRE